MLKELSFSLILFLSLGAFTACSSKAEEVAAQETAEQIEGAANAGREAAKPFVNREFKDTLEIQQMLLEARAKSSQYDIKGEPRQKEAFDSAFIATIRTVRPDLAKSIESRPDSNAE